MHSNHHISTDKSLLNVPLIHNFLSQSYWAKNIPLATVEKSIENSMCFGLYINSTKQQIGFARMITDNTTFAYLADVFILPEHQGQGLSKWLMEHIIEHPQLQGLRRIVLVTADAHGLYQQFGFTELTNPERFMHKHQPNIYKN